MTWPEGLAGCAGRALVLRVDLAAAAARTWLRLVLTLPGGRLVSLRAALHCTPFRLAPRDPRNCARSDPQACAAGDGHRQRCSARALLGCRASPLWPPNGCAPCHERINVDRAAALVKSGSSPLPRRLDAYSLKPPLDSIRWNSASGRWPSITQAVAAAAKRLCKTSARTPSTAFCRSSERHHFPPGAANLDLHQGRLAHVP